MALYFRPLFAVSQYVSPRAGAGYPPLSWGLFADVLSSKTEHIIYLPASWSPPVSPPGKACADRPFPRDEIARSACHRTRPH
jgi:hypothetical protein